MQRNQLAPVPAPPSARTAALEILCQWLADKKAVSILMDRCSRQLSEPDRQLTNKLVQGVLRQLHYLDEIIGSYSRHPPAKMKPRTLMALRLGVYQVLFLDRMPQSAAVNETVKAFKEQKQEQKQPAWLVSFVNGVLRTIARQQAALPRPNEAGTTNHPAWLVQRWHHFYGEATCREICRVNNLEPALCLRVNTRLVSRAQLRELLARQGIETTPSAVAPDALLPVAFSGSITALPGYTEGYFQVQSEPAQLVSYLLGPFTEKRPGSGLYLDGCAGLGGKTSHLAQLLPPGSELYAIEPSGRRFRLLNENLGRLQLTGQVHTLQADLARFAATTTLKFAAILIDAPCSGTGVIRRHPEIRWSRQEGDLAGYQKEQRVLLQQAAGLLSAGGILVYATCSIEPEENELLIASFLRDHPDFHLSPCRPFLPAEAASLSDDQGFLRCLPATGLDGFFAARLHKSR